MSARLSAWVAKNPPLNSPVAQVFTIGSGGCCKRQQSADFYRKAFDGTARVRFNAPRCPDSSVGRAGD
ncbi:hypothetical protein C1Y43_09540 [Pantoea sp. ICBG 828]|nr:hypothetical protein C1Y43_09540 [Pantoea sp. ICBG 828]PPC69906.1 hypothetical protein C1Y42_16790 [Pantoea sp. ICBG 985]